MSATPQQDEQRTPEDLTCVPMTHDEARDIFEENARFWLDMSGDEFLRKWREGEFGDIDYHPNHVRLMNVVSLLPLIGEDPHDR